MPRTHQQLHPHREPAATRAAATVLLLRDAPASADSPGGLEVLMTRRSPTASFAPNAYVFPGGG
ncbi:MAG: MBL fold metallo-hydrolase, partial [Acidovorax sp.]